MTMPASIYDELLAWSATDLEPWQQDALRRVVRSENLSPAEVEEVARIAYIASLSGSGIALVPEDTEPEDADPDSDSTSEAYELAPEPLSAAHVPARSAVAPAIRLKELRHLSGVNRLRPDEAIPFAAEGLSIVFGFNGVGKSGYTRILKRACHSRGPESILADVYSEGPQPPRAAITYLEGDAERAHTWDLDKDSTDPNLPRIAVYDHRSARMHLQKAGTQVELTPPGLDALIRLAEVYTAVATWARQEGARLNTHAAPMIYETATTPAVRTALDALGSDGAVAAIETLAALRPEEAAELGRLPGEIRALESGSLKSRLAAATLRESQCRTQSGRLTIAVSQFETEQIDRLLQVIEEHRTVTQEAAKLPEPAHETLEGVHGEHWDTMWEAALAYAREDAYPGQEYPSELTALCVLCQQTLEGEALDRLIRFAREARDNSATRLRRLERTYADLLASMPASISATSIDDALLGTMPQETAGVVTRILMAVGAARAVLEACRAPSAPAPVTVTSQQESSLRALHDELEELQTIVDAEAQRAREEADSLAGQSDDPAQINAKRDRLRALTERMALKDAGLGLRTLHNTKLRQTVLAEVIDQCATGPVSRKSTALSSAYITSICKAFEEEAALLGAKSISVAMEPLTTQRGARRTGIVLREAKNAGAAIEAVLSEGELRVISLAAFLADVRVADDDSAIVFDDPMTSLDHKFQEKVAQRLVREARSRQVLVFTHSSAFMTALFTALDEEPDVQVTEGIDPPRPAPCFTIEITKDRASGYAGVRVETFLTPTNRFNLMLDHLEHMARDAEGLWEASAVEQYERAVENFATHVRRAWESGVEDLLLYRVVMRNRTALKTEGRVAALIGITPAEVAAVNRGMDVESFYLHPTPDGAQKDSPEPGELKQRVTELRAWAKTVRDRNKAMLSTYGSFSK